MNKTQLVAKTLDQINEIIHEHNQKPDIQKYGIMVNEQKKIISIVNNALSECWDMAGEEVINQYIIRNQESSGVIKLKESLEEYRDSLTSKQEDKK